MEKAFSYFQNAIFDIKKGGFYDYTEGLYNKNRND